MTPTKYISREEVLDAMKNLQIDIASDERNYRTIPILKGYLSVLNVTIDRIKAIPPLPDKSIQIREMIEKKIKQSLFTHEIESLQELLDEIDSLTGIK